MGGGVIMQRCRCGEWRMGESQVRALQSYTDQVQRLMEFNIDAEEDCIRIAQSFEATRRKWQQSEKELQEKQQSLMRSEIENSALEVKLKHARNQVDVEMKRRQKAETQLQTVERQVQLVGDLLQSDGENVAPLSDSVLAFFGGHRSNPTAPGVGNRLSMVEESCGSFLSDISYDQTEDDLDLEELPGKPVKLKPRERRVGGSEPIIASPASPVTLFSLCLQIREAIIAKTNLSTTDSSSIHITSGIECVPQRQLRKSRRFTTVQDLNSALPQINEADQETEPEAPPSSNPPQMHIFLHKTRFGKMAMKCRNCRILIHPECRNFCSKLCPSTPLPCQSTAPKKGQVLLLDFAPATSPMVPNLVIQCVNEIEKKGLKERGLYRISGCDRQVKELKQKLLNGKVKSHQLAKEDIHTVCGVLKDFLRNLSEPLLTFALHSQFLEAADILDVCESKREICQTVHALPSANKDTLAFLILHLYRVMRSPECKMDKMNLSRVFGPTIVGHSVPNPTALVIMTDTPRQAKVMSLLLSVPSSFWNRFLSNDQENQNCDSVSTGQDRLFGPVTSPEILASLGGLALQRKPQSPIESANKNELQKKSEKFFTSPNA
ncbi:hypothetical protein GDO78_014363 [Eleutherodactylus coqui]|uniref:Rho-GAP domain-containing protein n=1 Tax=Eleutherodactylus coqui TaxID=57060 RepID=A0A8J6JQ81_ELECQ|nr:hypothetical protein GDO78_014363 [Eleutherodactylus coqui]